MVRDLEVAFVGNTAIGSGVEPAWDRRHNDDMPSATPAFNAVNVNDGLARLYNTYVVPPVASTRCLLWNRSFGIHSGPPRPACGRIGRLGSHAAIRQGQAPNAELVLADARRFYFGQCFTAAVSSGDSMNHMLTVTDLKTVFTNIRGALIPNGKCAVDMNMAEAFETQ